MRILPFAPKDISNETIMSHSLMSRSISQPEYLLNVATLWKEENTQLTSLLVNRGLITSGIQKNSDNSSLSDPRKRRYKVVGNRYLMWDLRSSLTRKAQLVAAYDGATYVCDAQPNEPGKKGSIIRVALNNNWFSPKDVLELADGARTQVYNADTALPEEIETGVFEYKWKVIGNNPDEYVDPKLLTEGSEVGYLYNAFEEMSETAYEKYTFNRKAGTNMTIQRMKWSISGTADQIAANKTWIEHKGVKLFTEHQDIEMLKRYAMSIENSLLWGKSTVNEKNEIVLKDLEQKPIMIGDGLLNQGDGAFRFPYNGRVTNPFINNILKNVKLSSNNEGHIEVAALCGLRAFTQIQTLLQPYLTNGTAVEGEGSSKGINTTIRYAEFNGVRIIPIWYKPFDAPGRPRQAGKADHADTDRIVFINLGWDNGLPNIELVALGKRGFLSGTVTGINDGDGGEISNSVDGKHKHILSEIGIVNFEPHGIMEAFVPTR